MVSADGSSSAEMILQSSLHDHTLESLKPRKPAVQVIWGQRRGRRGAVGRIRMAPLFLPQPTGGPDRCVDSSRQTC